MKSIAPNRTGKTFANIFAFSLISRTLCDIISLSLSLSLSLSHIRSPALKPGVTFDQTAEHTTTKTLALFKGVVCPNGNTVSALFLFPFSFVLISCFSSYSINFSQMNKAGFVQPTRALPKAAASFYAQIKPVSAAALCGTPGGLF